MGMNDNVMLKLRAETAVLRSFKKQKDILNRRKR